MGRCLSKQQAPELMAGGGGGRGDGGFSHITPSDAHATSSTTALTAVGGGTPKMSASGGAFGAYRSPPPHMNSVSSSSFSLESPRHGDEENIVIALYPYESRSDGDLSMKKGEIFTLLESSNADWWFVKRADGHQAYVPRNFVAMRKAVESEEWYAGNIARGKAERLVLAPGMRAGTFLVRQRVDSSRQYALTINDSHSGVAEVKHYKIQPLDAGGYYITSKKVFKSIRELIHYYSQESAGLCHRLTIPAPRVSPTRPDLSHETQKNWEIPRHEVEKIEKLGDGYFGEVWYGKWRGLVEVAIKTMKPGTMSNEAFLGEAAILKECENSKLVKLYAVCTLQEPFYIITEYMRNGSLLTYLRNENNVLSTAALVDISSQVANGMSYLEGKKLVHRDLAARNVLVGDKISGVPEVKVADFGLARRLLEENVYAAQEGAKFPIKWTAPEAATMGNFTVKSDVWSYGILLFEIFSRGMNPYPGMSNRDVVENVIKGYRMKSPAGCPPPIYAEMLKCWDEQPERRPTFEALFDFCDNFGSACQPNYLPPSVDDNNR